MGEAERLEDVLAEKIAGGVTGALDVSDGRRRWIFFVDGGALVYSRSNLKSESVEALREAHPDAGRDDLIRLQAVQRLRNALRAAPLTWSFKASPPEKMLPVPTVAVLLQAMAESFDEAALRERVAPLLAGWPRMVRDDIIELDGDPALEAYIGDLSGQRPGSDVLAFAPGSPQRALAGLWVAWRLGWLVPGQPPGASAAKGASSGVSLDLGFDLDALINEEVGRIDDPVQASAPAPAPIAPQAAPIAPPPAAPVEVVPQRHPMEDRLRMLADRVHGAANHFDVLGLIWSEPEDAFRAAYRDLARDLHPDRYMDASPELQELATATFDRIRAAWEVIGNAEAREKYTDQVVHGKKSEEDLAMEQLQAYWAAEGDFKRGLAAFNQGRITDAHEYFTKAVDAVTDELEFKAYYAYTSFALARTSSPERAQEFIDTLKNVIERNQSQERKLDGAWVLLGRAYRENNEPEKAKRCFVQALRINPANADATREMRRLTSTPASGPPTGKKKEEAKPAASGGGFFSRLFGGKK